MEPNQFIRLGAKRGAMWGIGQAARRPLSAARRRPKGRAQAPARGVADLNRSPTTLFGPLLAGGRLCPTQTVMAERNAG